MLCALAKHSPLGVAMLLAAVTSGCVLMPQHEDLVKRVDSLEKQVNARDQELSTATQQAAEQAKQLEALLRSNTANVGVRVDNLEYELSLTRGAADDAKNEAAAMKNSMDEMRFALEQRLANIENQVNSASNIPEGKTELLAAAESEMQKKNYKQARLLYRTFASRYPSDAKSAEVHFKIGLTLFSERDFRSALGEFYWVVQNAPESAVIHDALYYSGLAFAKIGQCDKAIAYFGALTEKGSGANDQYKATAKKQIETLKADDGTICTDKSSASPVSTQNPAEDSAKKFNPLPKKSPAPRTK